MFWNHFSHGENVEIVLVVIKVLIYFCSIFAQYSGILIANVSDGDIARAQKEMHRQRDH